MNQEKKVHDIEKLGRKKLEKRACLGNAGQDETTQHIYSYYFPFSFSSDRESVWIAVVGSDNNW